MHYLLRKLRNFCAESLKIWGTIRIKRRIWDREYSRGEWEYISHTSQDIVYQYIEKYAKGGNKLGHGSDGMATKIKVLGALAEAGIEATLAPGKEKDFILRAVREEKNFGTKFIV